METDPEDNKLERLFAAAREPESYPSDREVGFETRVMATIRAERERGRPFFVWAWRFIPVFISLVIILGIWSYAFETHDMTDLSAVTKIGNEETMLTAFLTGE